MKKTCKLARSVDASKSSLLCRLLPQQPGNLVVLAVLLALLVVAPLANSHAAPINYGSFMGTTTIYEMVQEDANSPGDVPPKFGAPVTVGPVTPGYPGVPCVMCSIPGDSLDFNPIGFNASSANGSTADITDAQLSFMASSKPGLGLNNILIQEFGDTTLAGLAGEAITSVALEGVLNINQVGGVGINTVSIPISITNFAPSGGTFSLTGDFPPLSGGGTLAWNGSTFIDLTLANPAVAAAYASQGLDPTKPVTKVSVTFDNVLRALSMNGTSALIAKKDHVIITTNIPEPATLSLVALVVLGGWAIRRR